MKPAWILALLVLLATASCPLAQEDEYADEYGDDDGGEYGDEGGYGGEGGGYGDYGDYGGMGGMGGGMGEEPSPGDHIKGVLDLDDLTYDKVIDGTRPVFIEFYAPWCGHCKEFKAEFEVLAEEMAPHPELLLVKIDADASEELGKRFGVEGFPTLMFLGANGEQPVVYEGERDAASVRDFLSDLVGDVGQLKALGPAVEKFLATSDASKRKAVISEVEAAMVEMTPIESGFAKWYAKIMNNVVNKGDGYFKAEFTRLLRMVYDQQDSLKEEKLSEFRIRLAVLKAFDPDLKAQETEKKEELRAKMEAMYEDEDSGKEEL